MSFGVSMVICCHNGKSRLPKTLMHLAAQKVASGVPWEAILVDNASTDGSQEMVAQEFPTVRLVVNSENRGFAAANNQAIKLSSSRYVLLLNSDTKILDGAVQKTLHFMYQRPEAAIVGCKLLNPDGTLQPSCRGFPSVWNLFAESLFLHLLFANTRLFGHYHMSFFDHGEVRDVDIIKGAFMMIRREVFETIGVFDESYFMYTEEVDFCYRAHRHGYRTSFFPSAAIIHYGGGSTESLETFSEQLHLTQLQFIKKHFRGIRRLAGIFLKVTGIATRVVVYFVMGMFTLRSGLLQKSRAYAVAFRRIMR